MLRIVGIIAVLGVLFAGFFASAELLTVNSGTVASGSDTSVSCQPPDAPLTVLWNDISPIDGIIESLTVSGINNACVSAAPARLEVFTYTNVSCNSAVHTNHISNGINGGSTSLAAGISAEQAEAIRCVRVLMLNAPTVPPAP